MVSQTRSMQIVTTQYEAEALLLEAQLIKRYRPPYNVPAARRQKLPLHPAARGSTISARPAASRRAPRQGAILRAVRERRLGPQHA
jgi:hypothetical protein